ncbi:hypothetical protein Ddye_032198 [Dipteronia dyeriana]|uniref:Uncharacterized protein n=1 Tax=Dipteronia dyeriana TaxID=168575 RepID=A0AAD9TJY4_9ROSI|nr:hypothetical protein Ddye_032198 [Dipteronia dyeriana]
MKRRLKDFLETLEGDWFKGKLTRHDHFKALARIDDALNWVLEDFAFKDRCRFMASCFRHFISMHWEMKFSDGVIHRLLLRELDHDGPTDEMRFLLGNHVVRFSKVEFYLITVLRFGVVPNTGLYAVVENDIHQWYFPGADEVSLEELRVVLTLGEFQEAYDAVKIYLLSRYSSNWALSSAPKGYGAFSSYVETTTGGSSGEGSKEKGGGERCSETEASNPSGPGLNAIDIGGSESPPRRVRHGVAPGVARYDPEERGGSIGVTSGVARIDRWASGNQDTYTLGWST